VLYLKSRPVSITSSTGHQQSVLLVEKSGHGWPVLLLPAWMAGKNKERHAPFV
jgi:hypothetical protein